MRYVPKELPEGINTARTNVLAEFGLLALALVGLVVGVFVTLGFVSDYLAVRMSPRLEAALGERFTLPGAETDAAGAERRVLDGVLARVPLDGYAIRLHVLCQADGVNAFAIPGGRLVVLDGLLDTVESENELAFVLAHELGHFQHRDHLRAFGRGLVWMTLLAVVGVGGDFSSRLLVDSGTIVHHRFSQRQELAADRFAVAALQRTYGHVGGATDFFARPALAETGGWLATHPASTRRVGALERLIAQRGWTTGPVVPYRRTATTCPSEKNG